VFYRILSAVWELSPWNEKPSAAPLAIPELQAPWQKWFALAGRAFATGLLYVAFLCGPRACSPTCLVTPRPHSLVPRPDAAGPGEAFLRRWGKGLPEDGAKGELEGYRAVPRTARAGLGTGRKTDVDSLRQVGTRVSVARPRFLPHSGNAGWPDSPPAFTLPGYREIGPQAVQEDFQKWLALGLDEATRAASGLGILLEGGRDGPLVNR